MGKAEEDRRVAYAEYVSQTIPEDEIVLIRQALQRNQLTGSNRFRQQIEKKFDTQISNRGQGRPRKEEK